MFATDHLAVDQPGALQDHNVLRDRVQRDGKRPGDLGDRCGLAAERGENRSPRWVRDRCEDVVEINGMLNHMVES